MTDLNLLNEPGRISLANLARREKVHLSTCWRWALTGIRGHILPTANFGGRRVTSLRAYQQWLAAINGQPALRSETPRQRERQIERAERRADELGL
jgi:hypothetical protein